MSDLGMNTACGSGKCIGNNGRTGRTRTEVRPHAFGSGEDRIVMIEIQCDTCGRRQWIAGGSDEGTKSVPGKR